MGSPINPISVVRRTFELYVSHAYLLLSASACLAVVVYLMESVAIRILPFVLVALIAYLAASAMFTGVVVRIAASDERERDRSITQIASEIRPVLGKLMLVIGVAGMAIGLLTSVASLLFLVVTLGVVVSTHAGVGSAIAGASGVTLLLVVAAVLLIVRWSVAAPVAVLERPGGLLALGRSGALASIRRQAGVRAVFGVS